MLDQELASQGAFSPWEPVVPEACNGSTGIWRDGGGNNQSPFYITAEVAALTGLPEHSLVAITTFGLKNRSGPIPKPYANATLASFFAVGIAKNWTSPMIIRKQPLFKNPGTTVWEDPYIYFDLQRKTWRVLYHEVPGKSMPGYRPMPGIHTHCGGYAESITPDLWGDWDLSPPQCGAYTLDIDAFVGLQPTTTTVAAVTPPLRHAAAADDVVGVGVGAHVHAAGCGKVTIHHTKGCWNDSSWNATAKGPVLPTYIPTLAPSGLSLESCAAACHAANLPVAGVEAGIRCFCGRASDLTTPAAAQLSRPKTECLGIPCGANPTERECGGHGRLLAYDYSCSTPPLPPPPPPPPHPPPPPPPAPSCTQKPPFKFGRSYAAFAYANLTSWGGNAVQGDDGKYHMFASVSTCVCNKGLFCFIFYPQSFHLKSQNINHPPFLNLRRVPKS